MNPIALLSGSKLSAMFVAAFVAVIGIFVVSNSEVILTSLGFQTKTSMAADIGKLNAEVKRLTDTNENLVKELEEAKRITDIITAEVTQLEGTKVKVVTVVDHIKENKAKQIAAALEALKASTSAQNQNAQQHMDMKQKIATETIKSLHEAYAKTVTPYTSETSSGVPDESVVVTVLDLGGDTVEGCSDALEQDCVT